MTAACARPPAACKNNLYNFSCTKIAIGGSSMNPMLKAQRLATSLDVYFSDPAHGDPIKNFNGGITASLGGVTIDLTKVSIMIDSSNGAGTCSGNYVNVSSAFGGATSMTVINMLLYQNNVSDAGGSIWYGQTKRLRV